MCTHSLWTISDGNVSAFYFSVFAGKCMSRIYNAHKVVYYLSNRFTAAASDENDQFASFSNHGGCVNVIAPVWY